LFLTKKARVPNGTRAFALLHPSMVNRFETVFADPVWVICNEAKTRDGKLLSSKMDVAL
jgi:hypothetical protein